MLQRKNAFNQTTMLILVIAASLAGCASPGTNTTSTESPVSSTVTNSSPSGSSPSNAMQANISIPGVNSVEEVKFSPVAGSSLNGSFDVVNNSSATSHEVPNSANIQVAGWAVLPTEDKPADTVIITQGENNSLVGVAPVNFERPDIVKGFKKPNYKNSGWTTTFNASTLPAGKTVLKAWAFNSGTKEAIQLGRTHEVTILN